MRFDDLLNTFANNLLPILTLCGAGFLLGRALTIDSRSLGRVVFYVFTPVLVFNQLLHNNLPLDDILRTVGFTVSVIAAMVTLAWLFGRLMRFDRPTLMAVLITVGFGNTGNYGLPLVNFAFGADALSHATLFFVTTSILFNTVGVLLASLGHTDFRNALLGLLRVPTVYAVILGAALNQFRVSLPLPIERTVQLAADGSIPLMLVLLGVELSRLQWSDSRRAIGLSAGLRLLAGPLVGLLLAIPFGLRGAAWQGDVIQSSMPAAVNNTVLAAEYRLNSSLVTGIVFLGTLLSPITLTLLLVYLGGGG
ncbi:MAG: AEC family transporter [Chloroflexota bacterium]